MGSVARVAVLSMALILGACQTAKRPDPQIVLADTDPRLTMQVVGGIWENTVRNARQQGGERANMYAIVRREPDLFVLRRNSDHGMFGAGHGHLLIEFATERTGADTALRTRILAVQNPDSQGNGRTVPVDDAIGWRPEVIKDWIAGALLLMQGEVTRIAKPGRVPVVVTVADEIPVGAAVIPEPQRAAGAYRVDMGNAFGACTGESNGGNAPNARGTWSIACDKGLRASGAFAMDAQGRIATGEGTTSDGRKVSYRFGPVR